MEEQKPVGVIQPDQADRHAEQDHPQSDDDQQQEQGEEQEKKPVEPIQPDQPLGMVKVAVKLERPASEELTQHDRAEKYRILRSNTVDRRKELIAWIDEQGLSEEVSRVGDATVFNMLFVVCTPRVAEELTRAPGVISVSPSEDFKVDLLGA
jgi:hypothetical protein